ncbi:MAG: sulfite exporter TauE/SafE family protein [Pseudomonadota bacterium]
MNAELIQLAILLAATGAVGGVMAGLFGIGGGAILVPMLSIAFGLLGVADAHIAHLSVATSMAIILPTAIRSYRAHRAHGAGDPEVLRAWLFWVPAGVIAAAFVLRLVPGDALRLIFAVFASVIAIKMLFNRASWKIADDLPGPRARNGVGFGIGVLSTFMGIGGGNLNNLFMTLYGRPLHQAVATSAGLGAIIAVPAVLGYVAAGWGVAGLPAFTVGYIHWLAVLLVAPFSMLTAPFGARLAHAMSARALEVAFGVFLILVAARFFAQVV